MPNGVTRHDGLNASFSQRFKHIAEAGVAMGISQSREKSGSRSQRGLFLLQVIGLATALFGSSWAYGETLKEAVEIALKTNPKVLAADAQKRAVTQDLAQAKGGYLPNIDLYVANGKEHTDTPQVRAVGTGAATLVHRESSLTLSQKLFDGRAASSEVERQNALLSAATNRLDQTREDIALRAAEVYLDVLKNRQLVKLANDNVREHLQTNDKITLRVKGGVSQRADSQQSLARVALAKSTVSARAGALRQAEAAYQAVIGRPAGVLSDPPPVKSDVTKAGTINSDLLAATVKQATEP